MNTYVVHRDCYQSLSPSLRPEDTWQALNAYVPQHRRSGAPDDMNMRLDVLTRVLVDVLHG